MNSNNRPARRRQLVSGDLSLQHGIVWQVLRSSDHKRARQGTTWAQGAPRRRSTNFGGKTARARNAVPHAHCPPRPSSSQALIFGYIAAQSHSPNPPSLLSLYVPTSLAVVTHGRPGVRWSSFPGQAASPQSKPWLLRPSLRTRSPAYRPSTRSSSRSVRVMVALSEIGRAHV